MSDNWSGAKYFQKADEWFEGFEAELREMLVRISCGESDRRGLIKAILGE